MLGPCNPAFVDATLSYQDMADGLHLETNPNGVLWRVNSAGIPTYQDLNNYFEQNRVVEATDNHTVEEIKPSLESVSQAIRAEAGKTEPRSEPISNKPLILTREQQERINNPYAGILLANGLPLNTRIIKTLSASSNGQWTLVFLSEGNYGSVILYDENKNEIFSCPATSGRIGVTDRSIKDAGPIPLGTYTLDPREISGGLVKAIERNVILREDWGMYRVPLKPEEDTNMLSRDEIFLHGGFFPGTAGCIDIGTHDQELFPLLMQHDGLINVKVIEVRNDMLFPNEQEYVNA